MKLLPILIASGLIVSCGKKDMKGSEEQVPTDTTEENSEVVVEVSETTGETGPKKDEENSADEGGKGETGPDKEEEGPKKDCTSKVITFDELGPSKEVIFQPGVRIKDQYAGVDFKFSTNDRSFNYGILFDSEDPNQEESDDFDLYINPEKTPDKNGFGNILILAENKERNSDGIFTNPDDNKTGGYIKVIFDETVEFEGITMIDMDEPNSKIELYGDDKKTLIHERPIEVGPNGGFEVITFGTDGPSKETFQGRKMKIYLGASGAVDNIKYCVAENPSQAN